MPEETISPTPETTESSSTPIANPESLTPIANPEALLRAFEVNKKKLEAERQRAAEYEQKMQEMQVALEAQKAETGKLGNVLEQIIQTMGGAAKTSATDPTKGIAEVIKNFDAQRQLEELQRQYATIGEQRAIEKLNPQLEQLRKQAETFQQDALSLRQRQSFTAHFNAADGKPGEMENFFRLYADRFKWDDSINDFTEFRDAQGNTMLDESGRPLKPVQALLKIRQGTLEGFGSMAQSAFVPFNQSSGGGTPASVRRSGGKTVQVYRDMQAVLNANPGVKPTELARRVRDGEIVLGE